MPERFKSLHPRQGCPRIGGAVGGRTLTYLEARTPFPCHEESFMPIMYWYTVGYPISAGVSCTIPSVLVCHAPSQISSWGIVYYPRECTGTSWARFGTVVHPSEHCAPLSSFQLQSQIWAVSCPHCSLHCFARGHRGHVGPFRPNGGLSATGDNKIADFSSHVVRVKESAARWWWLRSQTWSS